MDASAALLALVMNIFMESRGEGPEGMRAVADTVHTRVLDKRWPDNHVDVVLQSKQFSWTRTHKVHTIGDLITLQKRVLHSKNTRKQDVEAYKQATRIAKQVLSEGYTARYKYTHFHTTKVKPYWSKKPNRKIGNHVFMRY